MNKVYRAVPIDLDASTEPVQFVGTYVLRWPEGLTPQVGFVEANPIPSTERIKAFFDEFLWLECPACGEKWNSGYHAMGKCSFYNRLSDAKDCLKRLESYHP